MEGKGISKDQLSITAEARAVLEQLLQRSPSLIFHQSGGCCDGSAPMCFEKDEFMINETDIKLGEVCGCPYYMSKDQYEYWKHTRLTLDVVKGRGASFSLEAPLGVRFLIRSALIS